MSAASLRPRQGHMSLGCETSQWEADAETGAHGAQEHKIVSGVWTASHLPLGLPVLSPRGAPPRDGLGMGLAWTVVPEVAYGPTGT